MNSLCRPSHGTSADLRTDPAPWFLVSSTGSDHAKFSARDSASDGTTAEPYRRLCYARLLKLSLVTAQSFPCSLCSWRRVLPPYIGRGWVGPTSPPYSTLASRPLLTLLRPHFVFSWPRASPPNFTVFWLSASPYASAFTSIRLYLPSTLRFGLSRGGMLWRTT